MDVVAGEGFLEEISRDGCFVVGDDVYLIRNDLGPGALWGRHRKRIAEDEFDTREGAGGIFQRLTN